MKETCEQRITPFWNFYPLNSICSIGFLCSAPLMTCFCLVVLKFRSRFQSPSPCHRCGSVILPPLLLLGSWRSVSWSLMHDTLLEMETCVVTETIWSRRSFTTCIYFVWVECYCCSVCCPLMLLLLLLQLLLLLTATSRQRVPNRKNLSAVFFWIWFQCFLPFVQTWFFFHVSNLPAIHPRQLRASTESKRASRRTPPL